MITMGLNDIVGKLSSLVAFLPERTAIPDRFAVRPVDLWDGDSRAGALLFEGIFTKGDANLSLQGMGWEPGGVDESWLSKIHGFTWLRDLRSYANDGGIARGQASALAWMMILSWLEKYHMPVAKAQKSFFYRPDITGERLCMWISMFEFFCPERFEGGADEEFHDLFFESVLAHGQHLSRTVGSNPHISLSGIQALKATKGLLYAGLAIVGREIWGDQAMERLKAEIDVQILRDGSHISRSPVQLLEALQILLDIQTAFKSAGRRLPEFVQHAIDRIGPALRFYRYNDRSFGLFHGAQKCDAGFIDKVLAQTGIRGKALESLPCAGFERVRQGRTLLMFDHGKAASAPYDLTAHASCLSFELSYAKHRIFVNCGSHPHDQDWREALRGSAAHTALTLDGLDICDIQPQSGFGRKPVNVRFSHDDSKETHLLEASHDGYVSINGYTHTRRIFIGSDGNDIRGDDCLEALACPLNPVLVTIRFHIDPGITVSLINNGTQALLRLHGGIGWRFKHNGGVLSLEDSIYMGDGTQPRKTKQLVINGQVSDIYNQFKWCIRKEG